MIFTLKKKKKSKKNRLLFIHFQNEWGSDEKEKKEQNKQGNEQGKTIEISEIAKVDHFPPSFHFSRHKTNEI